MKNVIKFDNGLEIKEYLNNYGDGRITSFFEGKEVGKLDFAVFQDENRLKVQWIESNKKGYKIGTTMIESIKRIAKEQNIKEIYGYIKTSSIEFYKKIGAIIVDAAELENDIDRQGNFGFKIIVQ